MIHETKGSLLHEKLLLAYVTYDVWIFVKYESNSILEGANISYNVPQFIESTEEKHEELPSGYSVPRPRFKPGTYQY